MNYTFEQQWSNFGPISLTLGTELGTNWCKFRPFNDTRCSVVGRGVMLLPIKLIFETNSFLCGKTPRSPCSSSQLTANLVLFILVSKVTDETKSFHFLCGTLQYVYQNDIIIHLSLQITLHILRSIHSFHFYKQFCSIQSTVI